MLTAVNQFVSLSAPQDLITLLFIGDSRLSVTLHQVVSHSTLGVLLVLGA